MEKRVNNDLNKIIGNLPLSVWGGVMGFMGREELREVSGVCRDLRGRAMRGYGEEVVKGIFNRIWEVGVWVEEVKRRNGERRIACGNLEEGSVEMRAWNLREMLKSEMGREFSRGMYYRNREVYGVVVRYAVYYLVKWKEAYKEILGEPLEGSLLEGIWGVALYENGEAYKEEELMQVVKAVFRDYGRIVPRYNMLLEQSGGLEYLVVGVIRNVLEYMWLRIIYMTIVFEGEGYDWGLSIEDRQEMWRRWFSGDGVEVYGSMARGLEEGEVLRILERYPEFCGGVDEGTLKYVEELKRHIKNKEWGYGRRRVRVLGEREELAMGNVFIIGAVGLVIGIIMGIRGYRSRV